MPFGTLRIAKPLAKISEVKIIEVEEKKFSRRILCSLFPSLNATLIMFTTWIVFSSIFMRFFKLNLNYTDPGFWIFLVATLPLPVYLTFVKPYIQSRVFITRIEHDEEKEEMRFEYLIFNTKKIDTVQIADVEHVIFNSYKISLSDRIILYAKKKRFITQYEVCAWDLDKINELASALSKLGTKKPYGYNKGTFANNG